VFGVKRNAAQRLPHFSAPQARALGAAPGVTHHQGAPPLLIVKMVGRGSSGGATDS